MCLGPVDSPLGSGCSEEMQKQRSLKNMEAFVEAAKTLARRLLAEGQRRSQGSPREEGAQKSEPRACAQEEERTWVGEAIRTAAVLDFL